MICLEAKLVGSNVTGSNANSSLVYFVYRVGRYENPGRNWNKQSCISSSSLMDARGDGCVEW